MPTVLRLRDTFGLDHLHLEEEPLPALGPTDVHIRFHAASLNYRDLMVVRGQYNPRMALPRILGSDAAGEVVAVGPAVTLFQPGDRVASLFFSNLARRRSAAQHRKIRPRWIHRRRLRHRTRPPRRRPHPHPRPPQFRPSRHPALRRPHRLERPGRKRTPPCRRNRRHPRHRRRFALRPPDRQIPWRHRHPHQLLRRETRTRPGTRRRPSDQLSRHPRFGTPKSSALPGVSAPITSSKSAARAPSPRSFKAVRPAGHIFLIGVLSEPGKGVDVLPILSKSIHLEGVYVGSRTMFTRLNAALTATHTAPIIDRVFPTLRGQRRFHLPRNRAALWQNRSLPRA